ASVPLRLSESWWQPGNCSNPVAMACPLDIPLTCLLKNYNVRVRAELGEQTSAWKYLEATQCLSAPGLKLKVENQSVFVSLRHPSQNIFKLYNITLLQIAQHHNTTPSLVGVTVGVTVGVLLLLLAVLICLIAVRRYFLRSTDPPPTALGLCVRSAGCVMTPEKVGCVPVMWVEPESCGTAPSGYQDYLLRAVVTFHLDDRLETDTLLPHSDIGTPRTVTLLTLSPSSPSSPSSPPRSDYSLAWDSVSSQSDTGTHTDRTTNITTDITMDITTDRTMDITTDITTDRTMD
ncbi:unnamed protein product, partial [Coregonus sp. 'balchen']